MTAWDRAEIVDALRNDSDIYKLDDDTTLRFKVRPDEISFDDIAEMGDCYGRTVWGRRNRDTGHNIRPDGFDGNADIIRHDMYGALWWQPPADVPRTDRETFRQVRSMVRDILEYGFCGMIVELLRGDDAYGRPIVVDVASLWGIEPTFDDAYRAEIVGDLVDEIIASQSETKG